MIELLRAVAAFIRAMSARACSSYALAGLAIFLVVNLVLTHAKPLASVDPESLPAGHTWVWWAAREFLDQGRPPAVALLGSSLLMHPVSRADADHLNKDLDYVHHHRSDYMAHALSSSLGLNRIGCFNFALPGGMVSDDYLIVRALFAGERKPKIVVLALTLRDFMDSGVTCAAATPAFRYLRRFTNVDDLVDLAMPPRVWHRLDYHASNILYLWGKKLDLQVILAESLRPYLAPPATPRSAPMLLADPSGMSASNLRSEVEEGMFIVKAHQPYSFTDNTAEYRKRFSKKNYSLFSEQCKFLDLLLRLAQEREIEVIIVNMPLTQANMKLMPAGAYDRYMAALRAACRHWGLRLVDLNCDRTFTQMDFYDTCHMNASGGRKLIAALVREICASRQLAGALRGVEGKIAEQQRAL